MLSLLYVLTSLISVPATKFLCCCLNEHTISMGLFAACMICVFTLENFLNIFLVLMNFSNISLTFKLLINLLRSTVSLIRLSSSVLLTIWKRFMYVIVQGGAEWATYNIQIIVKILYNYIFNRNLFAINWKKNIFIRNLNFWTLFIIFNQMLFIIFPWFGSNVIVFFFNFLLFLFRIFFSKLSNLSLL